MTRTILSDLRGALRSLLRRPRFFALIVGAYALGIGVVTAVFGIVDDLILDPLPWPAAEEVVGVWERNPEVGLDRVPAAPAKIQAWRERNDVFRAVAAWRLDGFDLTGLGDPERLPVGRVEPALFGVLGVEAALGRTFTGDEATPGRDGVALLTHGFWTERFGADPGALGREVTLEGRRFEVVGVLPAGRHFPEEAEVVVPLAIDEYRSRSSHAYRALGRLAPGVTVDVARARLDELAARLEIEHADTDRGWEVTLLPLREQLVGDVRPIVLLVFGAGALVFLVACANGASLLLVRAAGRRRELGVRTSLGASRGRLVSHLAAESMVLALAGGVAGLALARLTGAALARLAPEEGVRWAVAGGFDATVYAFALALTLVAGLAFGLMPALHGTGRAPMAALREGTSTASRGRARVRNLVVAGEVAMAALLLVGGGLFLRSARALAAVDPGFEPAGLLTVDLQPPRDRYATAADRLALWRDLVDGVSAIPGVRAAGLVNYVPLGGRSDTFRFQIEERPPETFADLHLVGMRAASPGYFTAMGIDLLRGRGIEPSDGEDAEPVAVVNAVMAREFWPGEDVLGQRISFNGDAGPWVRIVGVVEGVRHDSLIDGAEPEVFIPLAQDPWPFASLVLRTDSGDPLTFVEPVRAAVGRVDPLLPLVQVRTGAALVEGAGAAWRLQALLVGTFAAVALLLAVTGVYGLMAHVVQERTSEMAIRQALGARAADLRRLVAGGALRLAVPGTAVGLVAAGLLSRAVRGMLYGVGPVDPLSYAGAAVLLVAVAVAAAWVPARRAARVDPAGALR